MVMSTLVEDLLTKIMPVSHRLSLLVVLQFLAVPVLIVVASKLLSTVVCTYITLTWFNDKCRYHKHIKPLLNLTFSFCSYPPPQFLDLFFPTHFSLVNLFHQHFTLLSILLSLSLLFYKLAYTSSYPYYSHL